MTGKFTNWIFVIGWAGLIFFLSHQPDLKSGLPNLYDFVLRKGAHITEYFVLALLLARALKSQGLSHNRILFWTAVLALLYAVSDEYHQRFIAQRQGMPRDVLIDGIGVALAILAKRRSVVK